MEDRPPSRYRQLRGQLVQILRVKCPSWMRAQVDDLAQEAVLKVWEIERRSEQPQEFSTLYLRKVAYSVVVDEIRRRARRKEDSWDEQEGAQETASARPGPEHRLLSQQLGEAIEECLQGMNVKRCRALILRRVGHNAQEVADLLGWGLKEARNRIYRGLSDLRSCLAAKGFTL